MILYDFLPHLSSEFSKLYIFSDIYGVLYEKANIEGRDDGSSPEKANITAGVRVACLCPGAGGVNNARRCCL